jgi:hypothetical protein
MDFDGYFADFFALIAPAIGLGTIDWSLVEAEHGRMLGTTLMHAEVTGVETDPMRDTLPTQRIATFSNRMRDEHMLHRLLDAVDKHDRVFATIGVTHAVMLEPALRTGLRVGPT